jgi:hypothetical protein
VRTIIAALIVTSVAAVMYQAPQPKRPDFSGHWVAEPPLGENDPRVPICNRECFMTQTGDELAVREQRTQKILSPAITFKFDGSPTSPPPEPGRASAGLTFRSNWKDDVLVIASEAGVYKTVARLSLREGRLMIEGERSSPPTPVFKQSYRKVEKF